MIAMAVSAGAQAAAPGGVDSSLALWLKADTGVTESGGSVSQWNDQSTNGLSATQAAPGQQPAYVTDAINFNPALDFDKASDHYLPFDALTGLPDGAGDRTFIAVATQESTGQYGYVLGYGYSFGVQTALFGTSSLADPVFGAGAHIYTETDFELSATPALLTGVYTYPDAYLYQNGVAGSHGPASLSLINTNISNPSSTGGIGGHADPSFTSLQDWDGAIAEVVVYGSALNGTAELQKIESYLSVKYGISKSGDYLASDGTAWWDATANGAYHFDVAGIARDDASALDQRKSKSVNPDALITIDLGGTFGADKAALMWGNDDGALSYSTVGAPAGKTIIGRTWKVQETGTVGSVTVSASDPGAKYLLVDADGDFSSGATLHDLTSGSVTVDLSDGEYFTLAADGFSAPGGVVDHLSLWLKADAGVSESGGAVSQWTDQGPNGLIAQQATAGRQPAYLSDGINFNPAVGFDKASDHYLPFDALTGLPDGAGDRTFIAVATQESTGQFGYVLGYGDGIGVQTALFGTGPLANTIFGAGAYIYAETDFPLGATPALTTGVYTNPDAYLFQNGVEGSHGPGYLPLINTNTSSPSSSGGIGGHPHSLYTASQDWDGAIAEVVVYASALNGTAELQKIESYLAVKYGISKAGDYLASDGTTWWDATANGTYHFDVAGIGRDDVSVLDQRKSKSVNGDALIAMELSAGFGSDKAALMWGNDNAAASYTGTGAPSGKAIMSRTWKVQETGTVGSVTVSTSDAAALYLLVDADGDFSSGASVYNLSSGSVSVDLNDGEFFTLATDPPAAASGLAAMPEVGGIRLDWTDNADTETGYRVMRSTSPGGPYTQVGTTLAADTESYIDTSVTCGTTYYYVVVAATGSVVSGDSNEASGDCATTIDVTSGADSGPGSLRDAITSAGVGDAIVFSGAGPIGITLTSPLPTISDDLIIDGTGKQVTIDADGVGRVFTVDGGNAVFRALQITGGDAGLGDGGGILAEGGGTITVDKSTITGNHAANGGGIHVGAGTTLVMTNSTVANNTADEYAGGIRIGDSTASASIFNSTIAGNSADHQWGGGIRNAESPDLTLKNVILTGNTPYDCHSDSGTVGLKAGSTHNIIVANASCTGGVSGSSVDPGLQPLADNGGDTPTMMLPAGSSAIDAGDETSCLDDDQRGVARPADGGSCDIGALEYNPPGPVSGVGAALVGGAPEVSWTLPGEGGTPTGYKVMRGTSPSGPFSEVGTADDSPFGDYSARCGQTYYYQVVAGNADGDSADSSPSGAVETPACGSSSGGVTARSNGAGSMTVSWPDADADSYAIYRNGELIVDGITDDDRSEYTFTDYGVVDGETYDYVVVAVDAGTGDAVAIGGASVIVTLAVPTLSEWAMLLLSLLLAASAIGASGRRRL